MLGGGVIAIGQFLSSRSRNAASQRRSLSLSAHDSARVI